jgi:hypothetical protein
LAEETKLRPKPMVEIGGRPILWHIMKHYARHGFNEFVVALGYRGEDIKRFFIDYVSLSGNLRVSLGDGAITRSALPNDSWTVDLVETGIATNTGGRLKRVEALLKGRHVQQQRRGNMDRPRYMQDIKGSPLDRRCLFGQGLRRLVGPVVSRGHGAPGPTPYDTSKPPVTSSPSRTPRHTACHVRSRDAGTCTAAAI